MGIMVLFFSRIDFLFSRVVLSSELIHFNISYNTYTMIFHSSFYFIYVFFSKYIQSPGCTHELPSDDYCRIRSNYFVPYV